ncbi:MAG TPA: hypothetical protein VMN60_13435 [Longimicrobiales bacterium]|nr:hypothetical protein [Longimicrobiales bacterium]
MNSKSSAAGRGKKVTPRERDLRERFVSRYQDFLRRFSDEVPADVLARALEASDERSALAVALAETV